MNNQNQDSPLLKLAHIEEYRKQKDSTVIRFAVETSSWSGKWHIFLVASIPSGWYTGSELIDPGLPFLRWRLMWAKRKLLKQWRIVCEMES